MKADKTIMSAILPKEPKTSGYDTEAQVLRIEGSTAWVHIPGGVEETPVAMTINASPGDTVRVRVAGGSAWLIGNDSAPPTDDKTAKEAQASAKRAAIIANEAAEAANGASGWTNYLHFDERTGLDVGYRENKAKTRVNADGIKFYDNIGGLMAAISNGADTPTSLSVSSTLETSIPTVGQVISHEIIGVPTTDVSLDVLIYTSNDTERQTINFPAEGTAVLSLAELTGTATYDGETLELTISTVGDVVSTEIKAIYSTQYYTPNFHVGLQSKVMAGNAAAIGNSVTASGANAFSTGQGSTASGYAAFASGMSSTASGLSSHAQNEGTIASKQAQTAIGSENKEDLETVITRPDGMPGYGQYAFIIGNGPDPNQYYGPSNAFAVSWDGETELYLNTSASSGTTDGDLYAAIRSAGWTSDVIV